MTYALAVAAVLVALMFSALPIAIIAGIKPACEVAEARYASGATE